jgi:opacity protein-like surface antigen
MKAKLSILHSFLISSMAMAAILTIGFAAIAAGQATTEHRWTGNVGGGPTALVGALSERLDNGWNFSVGGGYNFTSYFSGGIQFTYNGLGVSRGLLREAAVPDGNAHIWSITAEPKIRFAPERRFDPYVVGGVGFYRRVVQFTRPTTQTVLLFDPFFGAFFNAVIPVNQVIGTIAHNGVGGNAGGGFDVGIGSQGLKLFVEARYHYADTGRIKTRMVPVTFGVRW